MYYVYALQSFKDKNWLYIGYTDDLKARFKRHTEDRVKLTKAHLPLRLVYYEAYLNKTDAVKREYELKYISAAKAELKRRINLSLK